MQKKIMVFGIILGMTVLFSSPSLAGYISAGGGGGGQAEDFNLTLEGGATEIEIGKRKYLIAAGIPVIPHGYDNVPSDTIDGPCPHDDYVSMGEEYEGTEMGFYGKFGIEAITQGLYLSALLGFTRVTEIELTRSNPTGQYYEQASEKSNYAIYGAGIGYFTEVFDDWRVCFQLDVDNRRGVTGSFGFHW